MTKEVEYEQRNLKGFEGDSFMRKDFEKIIASYGINLIVETGTYLGGTTNQLRNMVDEVVTIEVNIDNFTMAQKNIEDRKNVLMFLGSSPEVFKRDIFKDKIKDKNVLFFLDAHWGNVCPLLDELKEIGNQGLKPVIIVHDFFVPNCPHLGYDSYNGQKFDYNFISKEIENIYGKDQFNFFYNSQATGAMRGLIYIMPK